MKVMATFDGSAFSEEVLPLLARLAAAPGVEFLLFSSAESVHGRREAEARPPVVGAAPTTLPGGPALVIDQPEPALVENRTQAAERRLAELSDYLHGLAGRLPPGANVTPVTDIADHPAEAIIRAAKREQPDVIVMATHGRTGLAHALVGSVAETVVRSSVAPVLLVHPAEVKRARQAGG